MSIDFELDPGPFYRRFSTTHYYCNFGTLSSILSLLFMGNFSIFQILPSSIFKLIILLYMIVPYIVRV